MKENILDELYDGNIQPYAKQFRRNSAFSKAINVTAINEEKLNILLDECGRKLLAELLDAQGDLQSIESREGFIQGFKLGMQVAVEVFALENDGDFQNIT